jgi:preprotein translocase subunit YajC
MDFIERIFGISPDGGSGVTEAMIIVAVIAMGSLIYFRRQQQRRSRRIEP